MHFLSRIGCTIRLTVTRTSYHVVLCLGRENLTRFSKVRLRYTHYRCPNRKSHLETTYVGHLFSVQCSGPCFHTITSSTRKEESSTSTTSEKEGDRLWNHVKWFSRGMLRIVTSTKVNSDLITSCSNHQVKTSRNRWVWSQLVLWVPYSIKYLIGCWTLLSLGNGHFFSFIVWVTENGFENEFSRWMTLHLTWRVGLFFLDTSSRIIIPYFIQRTLETWGSGLFHTSIQVM